MPKKDYKNIDVENFKIGVVGAGSWGTALAEILCFKGFKIDIWAYELEVKEQIEQLRENKFFLPNIKLSENLYPHNELETVVKDKDLVLIVVPSHHMRDIALEMSEFLSEDTIIVSASKGIENTTLLTMTGVLRECLSNIPEDYISVLSGPSFALEVAQKLPTVVVAASKNIEVARLIQHVFASSVFRVYTNEDPVGVELGGAVKNVIAIATGMADGLERGLNSRAALISRGLVEIRRIGLSLGANPHTFAGLAGIGDLLLTCTGELSRNYTIGKQLGQGKKIKDILSDMRMVAEGVKTAKSVYNLAAKLNIELPICNEVYHILYDDYSPMEAGHRLMTRDLNDELEEM